MIPISGLGGLPVIHVLGGASVGGIGSCPLLARSGPADLRRCRDEIPHHAIFRIRPG